MKKLGQTYTNCEKEFMENLQYMNRMNLDGLVYAMSKNKRDIVSKQDAEDDETIDELIWRYENAQ